MSIINPELDKWLKEIARRIPQRAEIAYASLAGSFPEAGLYGLMADVMRSGAFSEDEIGQMNALIGAVDMNHIGSVFARLTTVERMRLEWLAIMDRTTLSQVIRTALQAYVEARMEETIHG